MDYFKPGPIRAGHNAKIPAKPSARALRIVDDSMEPRFPHGAILVVDPEARPEIGNFVLACMGSLQDLFGQLVHENDKSYIKPVNPRYPAMLLDEGTAIDGVVRQIIFDVE